MKPFDAVPSEPTTAIPRVVLNAMPAFALHCSPGPDFSTLHFAPTIPLRSNHSLSLKAQDVPTGPLRPRNVSLPPLSTTPRAEPTGGLPSQKLPTPKWRSDGAKRSFRLHVFVTEYVLRSASVARAETLIVSSPVLLVPRRVARILTLDDVDGK